MRRLVLVALLVARSALGDQALVCVRDDKGKFTCADLETFLRARDEARDALREALRIREELAAQAAHGVYKL